MVRANKSLNKVTQTEKQSKTTMERVGEQNKDAMERVDKQTIRGDVEPEKKG